MVTILILYLVSSFSLFEPCHNFKTVINKSDDCQDVNSKKNLQLCLLTSIHSSTFLISVWGLRSMLMMPSVSLLADATSHFNSCNTGKQLTLKHAIIILLPVYKKSTKNSDQAHQIRVYRFRKHVIKVRSCNKFSNLESSIYTNLCVPNQNWIRLLSNLNGCVWG